MTEVPTAPVTSRRPGRTPSAAGTKLTWRRHEAPGATFAQAGSAAPRTNSVAPSPTAAVTAIGRVPMLVAVTMTGALAVPTTWGPNARVSGCTSIWAMAGR